MFFLVKRVTGSNRWEGQPDDCMELVAHL